MRDGFVRVAAATPDVRVGDVTHNVDNIIAQVKEAASNNCSLIVFPELAVTGYTCSDLFLQDALIHAADNGIKEICEETYDLDIVICVGTPIMAEGKLYNTCAVICKGEILAFVPKTNIPNYGEFYELRHFTPYDGQVRFHDSVPVGSFVFRHNIHDKFSFACEICEDMWVSDTPSSHLAREGALIICNPSASDEVIGKAEYRRDLVRINSAKCIAGYIYADCGFGESTQDLIFAGHNIICENGAFLGESKLFGGVSITYADIDLNRLMAERRRMNTFVSEEYSAEEIFFEMDIPYELDLRREFPRMPFVPSDDRDKEMRCERILTMQATGLATRLKHINCKKAVIGLSGGLDSTLALIVTVHAFDMLGLDRKGIVAVTMPCFGTTSRTKNNSIDLANAYGVDIRQINIADSVMSHFKDIGHDPSVTDVTYENCQARERTQVIMDLANQEGGLVVGTGDLSELALGWATYNGDHMSMYGVNASIPKTLVRHIVSYEADRVRESDADLARVIDDIVATPVSPELLPPTGDGTISQKTEELVGPYELHDFFLYYTVRFGFDPQKIMRLALLSFEGEYEPSVIYKWYRTFIRRFFSQQFKRSCLPDGPKVGTVTLSPRGDFRMPSDASADVWLESLDYFCQEKNIELS